MSAASAMKKKSEREGNEATEIQSFTGSFKRRDHTSQRIRLGVRVIRCDSS